MHGHQKRDLDLLKRMDKLQTDYDAQKIKEMKQLYRRLKSVYRAPSEAARQVLDALKKLEWSVCFCPLQTSSAGRAASSL
jgi:hypothetical protein